MIYEFLVDYLNTNEYFKFSVVGDKEEARDILSKYSNDVRFFGEREPNKKDRKVGRQFGEMRIVNCKYIGDKFRTKFQKVEMDVRKRVL